jgi:hypothetical protein
VHQWRVDQRGGARGLLRRQAVAQRQADAYRPVRCQRFFSHSRHTSYFEVANPLPPGYTTRVQSQADTLSSRVLQNLVVLEEQQRQGSQILLEAASAKEVSP